jgi:quinol-cytochrome oxidoreductase complex cytochrome b subunit
MLYTIGITIILQIITGILLGLHYTSDINSAYSSVFFFIREIYYGWCLHYLHSSGASFVFLFLLFHLGRAISYGSYFYNPNSWFSGILLFFFTIYFFFPSVPLSNTVVFQDWFLLIKIQYNYGLLSRPKNGLWISLSFFTFL